MSGQCNSDLDIATYRTVVICWSFNNLTRSSLLALLATAAAHVRALDSDTSLDPAKCDGTGVTEATRETPHISSVHYLHSVQELESAALFTRSSGLFFRNLEICAIFRLSDVICRVVALRRNRHSADGLL